MKRKSDPRHKMRVQTVKALFEKNFRSNLKIAKTSMVAKIITKQKAIDKLITQHAPTWPLNQIAPIDLATLRLAIFELLFKKNKEPYKVVIDEAVEIAKQYGSEASGSFVNGVLGSIVKSKSIMGTKSIKSTTS
ncbi:transcription antitermination factor NusB [Candidatus Curtissbacteria bacterium RIFCSPLOWO2_02_41_11]|uniref:Transcription antitermination protein NusB n=2 Tax=Candidatus Curtissiibacteriota TaxID=1752717 RepID=A0A1F5HSK2_9BACT|nr:MAG: transcription antitermination factor NusB [Candidatus Curtissbacteria bacterium RIFCSPHIGHO2_02_39_8]OGE07191.1 MAG: transcription antitermination factor NusB [Candidatus Curtissbacteria bacterium RIFCSPLOWO2_02_41_11]